MTLQQLWTRGAFVRMPSGAPGMVRTFDRRTNMVAVQAGRIPPMVYEDVRGARGGKPLDVIALLRGHGLINDFHFTVLRVGEQP